MPNIIKSSLAMEAGFYKVPFRNFAAEKPPAAKPFFADAPMEQMTRPAEEEGEKLLAGARREAEDILARARHDAHQIIEDAQKAAVEARREGEQLLAQCRDQLKTAVRIRKELICSAEEQVVELSIHIARRLVKSAVLLEPAVIRGIVAEAVSLAAGDGEITVTVNPSDLAFCRDNPPYFPGEPADNAGIKFLAAADVARGSCIVQGRYTRVESILEERFSLLREALMAEVRHVL